ncbi:MAG TPA: hypothetical protein DCG06_01955 [Deltaproteobacteria bacterium]|nr:hypothetical protein [Deltaproteobacteria bacterium]
MKRAKTPAISLVQPTESREISLAIVLAFWGRWIPISAIRKQLSRTGSADPVEDLIAHASHWNLEASRITVSRARLEQETSPLILSPQPGQFVVLEGRDTKGWWVNDPRYGTRCLSDDDLEDLIGVPGVALKRNDHFSPGGTRPSLPRSLNRLLQGTRGAFAGCSLAATGLVLANFANAGLLTYFMDDILPNRIPDRFPPFLLAVALVGVLRAAFTAIQGQFALRIGKALTLRLELNVVEHVTHLPDYESSSRPAGDIQQRLTMVRGLATSTVQPLALAPSNCVSILLFGTAITLISPWVALGVFGAVGFGLFIVKIARPRLFTLSSAQQRTISRQRSTMVTGLASKDWLVESGASRQITRQWMGELAASRNLTQESGEISLFAKTSRNFIDKVAAQAGALTFGGLGVIAGTVTIGELAALQALAGYFQTAVAAILSLLQAFPNLESNLARVDDILEIPNDESHLERKAADGSEPVLSFEEIPVDDGQAASADLLAGTISYMENIPREAMVRLGRRLRGLSEGPGRVFLGSSEGRSPSEIDTPEIRLLEGRCVLFPGSIEENLAGFDSRVPLERIWQALDDVGLGERLRAAESGLAELANGPGHLDEESDAPALELATTLIQPPAVVIACGVLGKVPTRVSERVLKRFVEAGSAVIVLESHWSPVPGAVQIPLRAVAGRKS